MTRLNKLRVLASAFVLSTAAIGITHGGLAASAYALCGASAFAHAANRRPECLGAYTQIQDVIQPAIWLPYTIQRSMERTELVNAGVVDTDPQFALLTDQGGSTINMPFWNDLSGEDEVLSDQNPLSTSGIDSAQDVAVMNNRGKAWKHNDLAAIFAGDDPAEAASQLVAAYWARRTQKMVLAMLKGIFSIASMASHVHAVNITAAGATDATNYLTGLSWIDAAQLLGDAKEQLTAAIMHSAVEASLRKQNLIEFIPQSQGGLPLATFQGKRVIVDDGMPVDVVGGVNRFTTYIFGRGAIALGYSNKQAQNKPEGAFGTWGAEFFREALAGNSGMITRNRFILHPRGIKWLGAVQAGATPSNDEYGNAANWLRVWDAKKIPIVAIQHNIPA
jgi:hypothetical protein